MFDGRAKKCNFNTRINWTKSMWFSAILWVFLRKQKQILQNYRCKFSVWGRLFFADNLYEECLERKTFEPEPGVCKRCSPQEKVFGRQEQAAAVWSVTVDFLLARGHFTPSNKAIGIDTRSEPLFLAGPKTLFPGAASPENLFTHIYLRIPRKNFTTYSVQFSSISAKTHGHQQKFSPIFETSCSDTMVFARIP